MPAVGLPSAPFTGPKLSFTASITGMTGVSITLGGVVTAGGFGLPGVTGGVPLAVALLCTLPAATSAAVTVYVAVQVMFAPTARVVDGQLTALRPTSASFTVTLLSATLPVLLTRKL